MTQSKYQKITIGIVILILLIGGIYVSSKKNSEPSSPSTPFLQDVTLVGEYVCLPHKDTSGPQTLECALGIKTDNNLYYALDTMLSSQNLLSLSTGERILVMGQLERIQDETQKYNTQGIIHVTYIEEQDTSSLEQTTSTGDITFGYPEDFGIAVSPEQILTNSYIPPCDSPFDYCMYYLGSLYENTNFESAGVRIQKRDDLSRQDTCLTTSPEGYANLQPEIRNLENYATSVFVPLGDAGAGHYASGKLYRLALPTSCYEFETRIGASQFANYEKGSIREFTLEDRQNMEGQLRDILNSINIDVFDSEVVFP